MKDESFECKRTGVPNLVSDYLSRYNNFEEIAQQVATGYESDGSDDDYDMNAENIKNKQHNNHAAIINGIKINLENMSTLEQEKYIDKLVEQMEVFVMKLKFIIQIH